MEKMNDLTKQLHSKEDQLKVLELRYVIAVYVKYMIMCVMYILILFVSMYWHVHQTLDWPTSSH